MLWIDGMKQKRPEILLRLKRNDICGDTITGPSLTDLESPYFPFSFACICWESVVDSKYICRQVSLATPISKNENNLFVSLLKTTRSEDWSKMRKPILKKIYNHSSQPKR